MYEMEVLEKFVENIDSLKAFPRRREQTRDRTKRKSSLLERDVLVKTEWLYIYKYDAGKTTKFEIIEKIRKKTRLFLKLWWY